MKNITHKKILTGALVASFLLGTSIVHAQDDAADASTADTSPETVNIRPTPESIRERREAIEAERLKRLEEVRAKQTEVREERAMKAEEIKGRVTEQKELRTMARAERAQEFVRRAIARVNNIADRMETFIPRIAERLDELEERGVDVSNARTELRLAQESIDSARSTIAKLTDLVDDLGNEDETTQNDSKETIRSIIEETKGYLKEARGHLTAAIREIKSVNANKDIETDEGSDEARNDETNETN